MTQEYLHKLFTYNRDTGQFIWNEDRGSNKVKGKVAGTTHKRGYIELKIDKKKHKSHRLAWLYIYGEYPQDSIDHINGIKDDNRIGNLRDVNHSINMRNRVINVNSRREHRNIVNIKNRYYLNISSIGYLGCFKTIEEAIAVRNEAMSNLGYTDRAIN